MFAAFDYLCIDLTMVLVVAEVVENMNVVYIDLKVVMVVVVVVEAAVDDYNSNMLNRSLHFDVFDYLIDLS